MTTEIFSKQEFETALPIHKETGEPLWKCLGIVRGEYVYDIDFGNPMARLRVRSSVKTDGFCADTGEDSIRAWIVDETGQPIGPKGTQRWVTRQPLWQERLLILLRKLANRAKKIKKCPCCDSRLTLVKIGKGSNKNKIAVCCTAKGEKGEFLNHFFEIVE